MIADGVADGFPPLTGHVGSRTACREAARLQHEDLLSRKPGRLEQIGGDARCLS